MTAEVVTPTCSSDMECMDSSPESHGPREMTTEKANHPSILPLRTKDNVCTGIVLLKEQMQFFKLNYPTDKLPTEGGGGGGHVMSELEIISECSHYQLKGSHHPQHQFPEWTEFQQSLKAVALRRFTAASTVHDSYKSFDVKFPQVEKEAPLLIRARDMVRLVSEGEHHSTTSYSGVSLVSLPLEEHFWAKVLSVTTLGQVTAICANDLTTTNLRRGDYISFPMACVLGVVHGSHWEYKLSLEEKKKQKKSTTTSSSSFEENDIKLLENQMGCSRGAAIEALLHSRGDLAHACMYLMTE